MAAHAIAPAVPSAGLATASGQTPSSEIRTPSGKDDWRAATPDRAITAALQDSAACRPPDCSHPSSVDALSAAAVSAGASSRSKDAGGAVATDNDSCDSTLVGSICALSTPRSSDMQGGGEPPAPPESCQLPPPAANDLSKPQPEPSTNEAVADQPPPETAPIQPDGIAAPAPDAQAAAGVDGASPGGPPPLAAADEERSVASGGDPPTHPPVGARLRRLLHDVEAVLLSSHRTQRSGDAADAHADACVSCKSTLASDAFLPAPLHSAEAPASAPGRVCLSCVTRYYAATSVLSLPHTAARTWAARARSRPPRSLVCRFCAEQKPADRFRDDELGRCRVCVDCCAEGPPPPAEEAATCKRCASRVRLGYVMCRWQHGTVYQHGVTLWLRGRASVCCLACCFSDAQAIKGLPPPTGDPAAPANRAAWFSIARNLVAVVAQVAHAPAARDALPPPSGAAQHAASSAAAPPEAASAADAAALEGGAAARCMGTCQLCRRVRPWMASVLVPTANAAGATAAEPDAGGSTSVQLCVLCVMGYASARVTEAAGLRVGFDLALFKNVARALALPGGPGPRCCWLCHASDRLQVWKAPEGTHMLVCDSCQANVKKYMRENRVMQDAAAPTAALPSPHAAHQPAANEDAGGRPSTGAAPPLSGRAPPQSDPSHRGGPRPDAPREAPPRLGAALHAQPVDRHDVAAPPPPRIPGARYVFQKPSAPAPGARLAAHAAPDAAWELYAAMPPPERAPAAPCHRHTPAHAPLSSLNAQLPQTEYGAAASAQPPAAYPRHAQLAAAYVPTAPRAGPALPFDPEAPDAAPARRASEQHAPGLPHSVLDAMTVPELLATWAALSSRKRPAADAWGAAPATERRRRVVDPDERWQEAWPSHAAPLAGSGVARQQPLSAAPPPAPATTYHGSGGERVWQQPAAQPAAAHAAHARQRGDDAAAAAAAELARVLAGAADAWRLQHADGGAQGGAALPHAAPPASGTAQAYEALEDLVHRLAHATDHSRREYGGADNGSARGPWH